MRKDFHTATGKLIGYTVKSGSTVVGEREDVYDNNGFCLGHIDDSGTYDDMDGKYRRPRFQDCFSGKANR